MSENITKEIQKKAYEILCDIDDFCKENDIKYYLSGGTCLGAVRHKGFIPWDDDIDIMMPRPDYNRFLREYVSKNYIALKPNQGHFFFAKVYDPKTEMIESGVDYKKIKPIGVSIDIFPLDGMVDDEKEYKRRVKLSSFFETLLRLSNQPIFYRKNPLKAINRIIPRMIGSRNLVKIIEKIDQKYDYEKSDFVIRFKTTPNGETVPVSKAAFEPIKKELLPLLPRRTQPK